MPFSKKTSTFTGSFSQKNSALAKQPSAYKLFFDRRGRYIFVRLAGFSTRFFWGHVAGECQSLPLACHAQTLDLPHPKPLTCHVQTPDLPRETLDLPHPNLWPPTPKALDPPHVAGLTTCVCLFCFVLVFLLAIFISSNFSDFKLCFYFFEMFFFKFSYI